MKKLLTLALTLVTLALAFVTPPLRGSRVMAQPTTRTIILNTGYDQWAQPAPPLIGVGQKDNEWRVIFDTTNQPPPPPPATGRPADVVSDATWIDLNPSLAVNFPHSQWISIKPNQGAPLPTPPNQFRYAYYFTLPVGFSNPVLTMKLSADDHITKVRLNNTLLFQGSGGIFINPPLMLPTSPLTPADFMSGPDVNVITVDVEDTAGGITGLIVDGAVTYLDCFRPPVTEIIGLNTITFWESTFVQPTQHQFAASDQDLILKRIGALSSFNSDFQGADGEFYDVFYSNWDGTFNSSGQFVTIEAEWNVGAPSGGGLNIARVDINFPIGVQTFANSVMSFVSLGDNAMPDIVGNAVDFDPSVPPLTDTTMGNTIGQTQRLRITLGFPCAGLPVCLQDDSNRSIVFQADPETGAYRFCCGGTTFTGIAQVMKRGNIVTFQQNGPDRRVLAKFDGGVFKGVASLQSPPGTTRCTITDRDTRNNTCVCQ